MRCRWLLLIIILASACGKPPLKYPKDHIKKYDKSVEPIKAPPAAYGNKIV